MKNKAVVGVIIALLFMISIFFALRSVSSLITNVEVGKKTIMVGDDIFSVDISDSDKEKEKGLSGRNNLAENSGMIFVYDSPRIPVFWMKGMNFPIDIIWISNGKVIGAEMNIPIEKNVPEAKMKRYSPPGFVDMALELSAGTVSRLMISIGEDVSVEKAD
jgi:hypothetical protein